MGYRLGFVDHRDHRHYYDPASIFLLEPHRHALDLVLRWRLDYWRRWRISDFFRKAPALPRAAILHVWQQGIAGAAASFLSLGLLLRGIRHRPAGVLTVVETMNQWPNKADALNAAVGRQLHSEHICRGVGDLRRWDSAG